MVGCGLCTNMAFGQVAAPNRTLELPDQGALLAQTLTADHPWVNAPNTETFVFSDQDGAVTLAGGARTVVIRSGESDAKATAALEEDLNIMSRILGKSVQQAVGHDDATAMGMRIRALTWTGAHAAAQNLYLDGYGALFFVNVQFPLVAPPQKHDSEKSKEPVDSTWEETKRELYGSREASGLTHLFSKDRPRVEYDSKKVEKLKDALVQALKNGTNIRNLKPEDFVTVTVIGADNSLPATVAVNKSETDSDTKKGTLSRGRYEVRLQNVVARAPRASGDTVMTVRAKKADVDNFAGGRLTLEQFRAKVSIATY